MLNSSVLQLQSYRFYLANRNFRHPDVQMSEVKTSHYFDLDNFILHVTNLTQELLQRVSSFWIASLSLRESHEALVNSVSGIVLHKAQRIVYVK